MENFLGSEVRPARSYNYFSNFRFALPPRQRQSLPHEREKICLGGTLLLLSFDLASAGVLDDVIRQPGGWNQMCTPELRLQIRQFVTDYLAQSRADRNDGAAVSDKN